MSQKIILSLTIINSRVFWKTRAVQTTRLILPKIMKGLKVAMVSLHIYILFTVSARMEEGCRRMKVMDKVRKDRAFRLSHCLDSSVGQRPLIPDAC